MRSQCTPQLPPLHCAPHSMVWPATVPAASLSHSSVRRPVRPTLHEQRQDPRHLVDEVLGVARGGVAGLLLLEDRHRDFGEVVHLQIVDGPPGHLAVGCLQPISPESLARGDAHGPTGFPHGRTAGNAIRRTASAPPAPPPSPAAWARTSTRGVKPSGSASDGGRASGTAARPPAT